MKEDHILNVRVQTSKQRMERMKLKRLIRKQRLYGKSFAIQTQQTPVTQQYQKQHLQKLKNRQAAQKSRQQKKQYVAELQQQIKILKRKLSQLRHCQNCQKQLQILPTFSQTTHQQSTLKPETFSQEQQPEPQQQSEESQFFRMASTQENSSIGIYLFVFMIMLGVFCIGSRMDPSDAANPLRRDLTHLYSSHTPQQDASQFNPPISYEIDTNMKTTYSTFTQMQVDPKDYENGLLSMDQVRSSKLISDEKYFEKIVNSFEKYKVDKYDQKNLRSKGGLIDANKSLLFCSRPKIYHSNPQNGGILTTFIDIFVKGGQITNIFPVMGQQISADSRNFQLNGLYKITASVEQIQQIVNPNMIY